MDIFPYQHRVGCVITCINIWVGFSYISCPMIFGKLVLNVWINDAEIFSAILVKICSRKKYPPRRSCLITRQQGYPNPFYIGNFTRLLVHRSWYSVTAGSKLHDSGPVTTTLLSTGFSYRASCRQSQGYMQKRWLAAIEPNEIFCQHVPGKLGRFIVKVIVASVDVPQNLSK